MEIMCARNEEMRIAKEFDDGHVMVYAVEAHIPSKSFLSPQEMLG